MSKAPERRVRKAPSLGNLLCVPDGEANDVETSRDSISTPEELCMHAPCYPAVSAH